MRNEAKLKNWGLAGGEKFYYMKFGEDEHGHATRGVATVCVIPASVVGGKCCGVRGVAFCAPSDQFVKKVGRAIALGRAVKAIETHAFTEPIPKQTPAGILISEMGWAHFSTWDIILTESEKALFLQGGRGETN